MQNKDPKDANLLEKIMPKNLDIRLIKGIVAIAIGVILLFMSYKVIFGISCLIGGLVLLYIGTTTLGLKKITEPVDHVISKVKKYFS